MKTLKLLIAAFAVFTFAATANLAHAQTNSTTATATVTGDVVEPLVITNQTGLEFSSTLFRGTNETISPQNGATFTITGEVSQNVTVDFTLPGVLAHETSTATDGSAELPISFAGTDLVHNTSGTFSAEDQGIDPSVTLTTSLDGTTGELYLWLGGTVQPGESQVAGAYTGTITAETSYTQN